MLPHIAVVFAYARHFRTSSRGRALTFAVNGLLATVTATSRAQPAPPSPPPDIYLAAITSNNGVPTLGMMLNITDRVGYDNQPMFTGDGSAIFFTSVRDDAQADIYRYDIASRQTTRITTTAPESEYSATLIEGGRAISVVRVERDSTQRLWRFPLDGGAPSVILGNIKPVGYQAWADSQTVALFVLGSPATLQLADTRTGSARVIASGIGRSLHRIPGTNRVSFVRKVAPSEWWIEALDPATRKTRRLVRLPEGVEDYAWMPAGSVICGRNGTLLWWSGKSGDAWRQIADLTSSGVNGITRIAISPQGDRLALVAEGRIASR